MVSQAPIMILFTVLIGYGGGVGMSWATHPVHILFSENFHFLSCSVVFFLGKSGATSPVISSQNYK